MHSLARIISFITNPIFILFPVPYLLVYRFGYGHELALKWTLYSLIFFIIAGIFVIYEVKHKVFSDMDVSRREQRPMLFSVLTVITFIYFYSLYFFSAPPIIFITVWGVMAGILMASVINQKIKASLHVGSLTAVLITIAVLYNISPLIYLLIPLVCWSRITIKRHTLPEVISGFLLGICLTLLMYILLKYIYAFAL